MNARHDSSTGAAERAFDPTTIDDDTRAALERVSRVIWRCLLWLDEAERRDDQRQRSDSDPWLPKEQA